MHAFQKLKRRSVADVVALALLLSLCASVSFAQQSSGTIRGEVVDEFGGLLIGANISVTDASGVQKTAVTNDEGRFTVTSLAPGRYLVRISAPGFADYENAEVDVAAGRREELKVTLNVTIEKQEVTVAAETPLSTEAEDNAGALVLRGSDLDALPDDPDELAAALQALAGPSAGPNGGQFFIDGFSGGTIPPKDSIREIRINQNPFSAEFDRIGFGRVEIFTKPGTDRLRGQAFLSFNDESLNSRNPFAPNRAPYQRRFYTASLSGPVIPKKASFFLSFARNEENGNAVINATILDPAFNITPFSLALVRPTRFTTFFPRFDYQLNPSNTLVASYSYNHSKTERFSVGDFTLLSRGFDISNTEHTVRLTETAVLSPKVINETRFQFIRNSSQQEGDNSTPGIIVRDAFTGGGSQVGLSFNDSNRYELQNYTSWTLGHHAFKAGARLRRVSITDVSHNNFGGTFIFTSIEQYRQVLLGAPGARPAQFTLNGGDPEADVSQTDFGGFIQDDWRVRPNLTLSGGLRYEAQTNISSNLNFAPRLAFAWSPGAGGARQPKTVLRGGFGVFYDRFGENFTLQADRLDGTKQQQFIVRDPNFFGVIPPVETLAVAAPQTLTTRRIADNLQAPYTMQSAFSVERLLPGKITLTVTFINARTMHVLRSRNINAPLPGTFNPLVAGSGVRPFGNVAGNIYLYESSGVFNQNQLIISANNRFSRALTLFGNYTLNRARSDSDGAGSFPVNSYDTSGEYGRDARDVRHRLFLGGSIAAPWGLRLNPLIVAFSGRPFNIATGLDTNGDQQFNERPAFATDLTRPSVVLTRFGAFDTNPLPGQEIIPRNFGNGPSYISANLQISKTFGFGTVPRPGGQAVASAGAQTTRSEGQQQQSANNRSSGGGSSRAAGSGNRSAGGGSSSGNRGAGGTLGIGQILGGGGNRSGSAPVENRYNFTFSVRINNIFNRTNPGLFIGNLRSRLFGQANNLNGGFGGFGGDSGGAGGNRTVDAQIRFSF